MKKLLLLLSVLLVLLAVYVLSQRGPQYDGPIVYFGIKMDSPEAQSDLMATYKSLGHKPNLMALDSDWSQPFPSKFVSYIMEEGSVPFIRWYPSDSQDPLAVQFKDLSSGIWDEHIELWAERVKELKYPVYISFAPQFNKRDVAWSILRHKKAVSTYKETYTYIAALFEEVGAYNVNWVFDIELEGMPKWRWDKIEAAYPGDAVIDWVGVSGAYSKSTQLSPFIDPVSTIQKTFPKPIMISSLRVASLHDVNMLDLKQQIHGQLRPVQAIVFNLNSIEKEPLKALLDLPLFQADTGKIQLCEPYVLPTLELGDVLEDTSGTVDSKVDFSMAVDVSVNNDQLIPFLTVTDDTLVKGLAGDRFKFIFSHPLHMVEILLYQDDTGFVAVDDKSQKKYESISIQNTETETGYELTGVVPLSMIPSFLYSGLSLSIVAVDVDGDTETVLGAHSVSLPKL